MKNIVRNIALFLAVVSFIISYIGFCIMSDEVMHSGLIVMFIAAACSLPAYVEDWKNEKNNAR